MLCNANTTGNLLAHLRRCANTIPQFISRNNTMKNILHISLLSLAAITIALPASAGGFQGPRGTTAEGNRAVFRNPSGGTTGAGTGSVGGFRGGSASGQGAFRTDGQGNVTYQGSGTATTPQGQTYNGSVSGDASYNSTDGYSGGSTVTVNDQTYQSTTQDGTTTVTNSAGETRVFQRRFR
jgi:hypothetical protein